MYTDVKQSYIRKNTYTENSLHISAKKKKNVQLEHHLLQQISLSLGTKIQIFLSCFLLTGVFYCSSGNIGVINRFLSLPNL